MPTPLNKKPKDYQPGWIDIIGVFLVPALVATTLVAES
jgi:hypothetical protein